MFKPGKMIHHQAFSGEHIQHSQTPRLRFPDRVGYQIICVLPDHVLDDTPLVDPETALPQRSLRQECSSQGLCYVRVRNPTAAEDLYQADVWANANAAASDLASDAFVVLTEDQLAFALAWDERLRWRQPASIRRLMAAQSRDLETRCLQEAPTPTEALFPVPELPLERQAPVEVGAQDLQAAMAPASALLRNSYRPSRSKLTSLAVQQRLLRVMLRTLQQQVAHTRDEGTAQALQARCVLVAHMQRWQQQTRQRVVNAAPDWSEVRQCWVWNLTLGVPAIDLEAVFAQQEELAA